MKHLISQYIQIFIKHKQLILYLFFGVCTTAINTVSYWLTYDVLTCDNITSTIFAWIVAVAFAFITNKLFVFESRRTKMTEQVKEVFSFFGCRVLTGVLDVVIMAVAVDMLKWNSLIWKVISNIIVTIINYIASKFLIFKNTK